MVGCVTEAWSHDEDRRWKKCNRSAQECNGNSNKSLMGGGRNAMSRDTGVMGAYIDCLLECILGHGKVIVK